VVGRGVRERYATPAPSQRRPDRHSPLLGNEPRELRILKRDAKCPFVFASERGAPFSVSGLQKMIERAGIEAKMPLKVHPHMLRHAAGYVLANKGTDTRTLQATCGTDRALTSVVPA